MGSAYSPKKGGLVSSGKTVLDDQDMSSAALAVREFWRRQPPQHVRVLTESGSSSCGSLVVTVENRYLIWETWGELDLETIEPSLQVIVQAHRDAYQSGGKLASFCDFSRLEGMTDSARSAFSRMRGELVGPFAPERMALVFESALSRILFDMITLLMPAPWDERVFPATDEALTWIQNPDTTLLLDVDGLNWVLST